MMEFIKDKQDEIILVVLAAIILLICYKVSKNKPNKKTRKKAEIREAYMPALFCVRALYDYSNILCIIMDEFFFKVKNNIENDCKDYSDVNKITAENKEDYELELSDAKYEGLSMGIFRRGDDIKDILTLAKQEKDAIFLRDMNKISDKELYDDIVSCNDENEKLADYFISHFYNDDKYKSCGLGKDSSTYREIDDEIENYEYETAFLKADEIQAHLYKAIAQ